MGVSRTRGWRPNGASLEPIQRDPEIRRAVAFGRREATAADIDLDRGQQQLRGVEFRVPRLPERDELILAYLLMHVLVARALLSHGGFPGHRPPAGTVIMANEYTCLGRQREDAPDRAVQRAGIAARKIGARRAIVGHEQRVSHEGGIAHKIADTCRRVTGAMPHLPLQVADLKMFPVSE